MTLSIGPAVLTDVVLLIQGGLTLSTTLTLDRSTLRIEKDLSVLDNAGLNLAGGSTLVIEGPTIPSCTLISHCFLGSLSLSGGSSVVLQNNASALSVLGCAVLNGRLEMQADVSVGAFRYSLNKNSHSMIGDELEVLKYSCHQGTFTEVDLIASKRCMRATPDYRVSRMVVLISLDEEREDCKPAVSSAQLHRPLLPLYYNSGDSNTSR